MGFFSEMIIMLLTITLAINVYSNSGATDPPTILFPISDLRIKDTFRINKKSQLKSFEICKIYAILNGSYQDQEKGLYF